MSEHQAKLRRPWNGDFIDAFRTGVERADAVLLTKQRANAKLYANLSEPTLSRQVQRRAVRTAVSHQIAAAKAEAIRNRRKGKSK